MTDRETLAVYDARADEYAQLVEDAGQPDTQLRHFLDLLPDGADILDLGCGPGRSAQLMAAEGHTVTAMDASARMVELADRLPKGPVVLAVNPGSMLASKMVKEAYGVVGGDLQIGAGILARAALSEKFGRASGQYFDNDSRRFVAPHRYALDAEKCRELVQAIEAVLTSTPRG